MGLQDEPARGRLHRGLVGDRAARFLVVELAELAELTRARHDLGPDAARLGAEALVAAALMSAWIKGEERITLQLQGERPALSFVCDVDAEGGLRARVRPADLHLPADDGVHGLLLAIKADAERERYRGITALEGRSIEAALAGHLSDSSQVDVVLRIGVHQGKDGQITFAGGLLVERLPAEPGLPSLEPAAFQARFGGVAAARAIDLVNGVAFGELLGEAVELLENRSLRWRCSCSQARIEAVLAQLGTAELTEMLAEDNGAEVGCHFCNLRYQVGPQALAGILSARLPALAD